MYVSMSRCPDVRSGQRKSSAVLCGPPISLEMETNYPYLHGWPQKYRSAGIWASHFVRNGNKLSISSWLATEVQVCRNVGRPNPRRPNLVIIEI